MMDKTIKINLGGILFQIDEEAYKIIRGYLQDIDNRLKNTPGGAETIEDIESRIAEIFQSQGGSAGVISRDNVEAMIAIIGKPEDFETEPGPEAKEKTHYGSTSGKRLYRNPDDKIVSGVCSGLGAYLNIDSVWIRLMFIIFTCFFGIGFLVYLALWIALPSATTDQRKREMYGRDDYAEYVRRRQSQNYGQDSSSRGSVVGNAFNEVFRAIGKVCYIVVRIFLIIVGIMFVVTGFIILVSLVMVFFFKYPEYLSAQPMGLNLFYFPDFLNYIVSPPIAPWILVLSFLVILFPLLAIIYWGVKMIFWFRARDGVVSLICLVIWVMCLAALSILLFNEGISFAQTAKSITEQVLEKPPQKLYIVSDKSVSDLKYDKEISFGEENYNLFFNDNNTGLYITANLIIDPSEDNSLRINVRKRSAGKTRMDAEKKSEALLYNYMISGDSLYLDEYFSVPQGYKWSGDDVSVTLYVPEGTLIIFDRTTENMYRNNRHFDGEWDHDSEILENEHINIINGNHSWEMTREGLKRYYKNIGADHQN